ncbi:hypothetical protein [Chryseobacterium limigenitum]|uniref:Uncharacterized protein n=1 Tax=Chryseobacterium limigenitum TaxID=1612149 RepID=A0A1K2IFN2_9FLAO|nr:hypothetical protein [Chryseobacterium limigenitum]SFZ91066.1 hypothetical protein SAMN05216324_10243 [Chryseobacterium limigenitum]
MKKLLLLQVLFLLALQLFNAQSITFISEKNNKPLSKVSVFGKNGNLMTQSDIDGKIDKQTLNPPQEKYDIVYNNIPVTTLSYSDFDKAIIKINDQIKEIQAVVISKKPAKYLYMKGNFNTYVTVNNRLNCYADGVVTYIFDNKTKKLKSTNIEQYRVYTLIDPKEEEKLVASWDFQSDMEIPDIKHIGNLEKYNVHYPDTKELKGDYKDEVEMTDKFLQKKPLALFGFRIFDMRNVLNISYEKDSKKTLKDFLEYNELNFTKIKHKSEQDFSVVVDYKNFYPTDISFSNEDDIQNVRFDRDNSNYKTQYWQNPSFPNMQSVFSSYFKDDLKEKENKK